MSDDGILSDSAIADAVARGDIEIDPFDADRLNPASYDCTLGEKVCVYAAWVGEQDEDLGRMLQIGSSPRDGRHLFQVVPDVPLDVKRENPVRSYTIGEDGWVLQPGILYLMHTRETIGSRRYVSCADGKSSLGRYGIVVHQTAGYVDVGFRGQVTLEVTVTNPIRIHAGMRFCQLRFHTVVGHATPYAGNYVGETSRGPVPSRAWKQFR